MQGYSKLSFGPFMLVHYNGLVEACMQRNSKANVGRLIPVY
jgi:hypothetical protein